MFLSPDAFASLWLTLAAPPWTGTQIDWNEQFTFTVFALSEQLFINLINLKTFVGRVTVNVVRVYLTAMRLLLPPSHPHFQCRITL